MTTREGLIKHWKEIKAFKNGAEIELLVTHSDHWSLVVDPMWNKHWQYRVKCVPKKISVWVNVYPRGTTFHHTKAEANACTFVDRTACVELTGEYEDGDGLRLND